MDQRLRMSIEEYAASRLMGTVARACDIAVESGFTKKTPEFSACVGDLLMGLCIKLGERMLKDIHEQLGAKDSAGAPGAEQPNREVPSTCDSAGHDEDTHQHAND